MMIRPVEEYEKEENSRRNAEIVESRMIQDKLEKEKRSLVERASKGKATEEEVRAKAAELAKFEPTKPLRLFVDDVTSEKLTSVLAENKGRAAVVSAEGGIFSIMSGLYNRNVNIDVFLKGHSGDTIRVDRVGRASESIIHLALTMVLAVQPAERSDEQQHLPWARPYRPIPVLHAEVHRGQALLFHEADPGRSQIQVSGSD